MENYIILRRNGWTDARSLEEAAGRSSRVGTQEMPDRIRWIRSYVIEEPRGGLGTVCVYQATDVDAIREHAERAGLPCDAVIPIARTVIVNEDPKAA